MNVQSQIGVAVACAALAGLIGYSHEKTAELLKGETLAQLQDYPLPSPYAARTLALGYDQLLADCYWLAFVQYIGDGEARTKDRYAAADNFLDLIVGLDPGFIKAYWFAAFTIGRDERQPDRAAKFIDRGIQANPNNWSLPFIAGINQYLYAKNDLAAAKYYQLAAQFPDAPKWLGRQAMILAARIPSTIKEINIWDSVYHSGTDQVVKEQARARLIALWSQVYKSATTETIRNKARSSLNELGIVLN